jgi:hypothetical protein
MSTLTRVPTLPMLEAGAWMSRIAVRTSEIRPVFASATSRPRAAVIAPSVLWMIVAPIGLLIVPFRMMSDADGLRFRICTSVGATMRFSAKVSDTFRPFRSTNGVTVVLTTSMLLIFSGLFHWFVIRTWRNVSLKSQLPPLPKMDTVPVPLAAPASLK